jgi:hypothetical protein
MRCDRYNIEDDGKLIVEPIENQRALAGICRAVRDVMHPVTISGSQSKFLHLRQ